MSPADDARDLSQSLFLLDGSALAYRAHFAMARSGFSSAKGVPTGATYGFTAELKRLLERVRPRYVAVVFDTKEPTFRHERYPDYKATREKMPPELVEQIELMHQSAKVLGFPLLARPGYEADDVIGTLARRAAADGLDVYIVTGDKDFMQLVDEHIALYNIMKKGEEVAIIRDAEVEEKFGVAPGQVIDVLALMGDSSDNVPGIPGVGPKTATKLIQKFGSLEAVLDSADEAGGKKLVENLKEHRELGLLSKELVTIDVDVPELPAISELEYEGPDRAAAAALFRELDFRTFAQEMMQEERGDAPAGDYEIVDSKASLEAMLGALRAADLVAVDTETTGLDARKERIVGFSFARKAEEAWYVPLNAEPPVVPDPKGAAAGSGVVEALRGLIEDPKVGKCGQNLKYDLMVMRNHGLRLAGIRTDSMISAYLLEPQERERGLDALSLRHFDFVKIKTEEIIGKGKEQVTMAEVPIEKVGVYACEDADFTWRLSSLFLGRLEEQELMKLHDEVEIPLIDVLADMEEAGVRVDPDLLRKMAEELRARAEDLKTGILELAGKEEFNPNSPKQLGEVLFDELKVHEEAGYKPKKTRTGAWATGQEVLEALSHHPLPAQILEYRSLTKLVNTYVGILPDLVDEETGRIHASFNQTVAATGRLSSSDPNLQNIPIRTEAGRKIREAFLPTADDWILISADYSQVELRIMAHLSEDPVMIQAFEEDVDIHRDTASRVFDVTREEVTPLQRSRAKAINFGILYGMGPQRLSRETRLSLGEAKEFIERYFEAFPTIRDFIEGLKDFARKEGYAQTLLGRRRPIPDIDSSNRGLKVQAENMAVNTPIQGSAADILKVAMVRLHRRMQESGGRSRMILTVHDELVFDAPQDEAEALEALVRKEMEGAWPLRVPLKVEVGRGRNWLEAH